LARKLKDHPIFSIVGAVAAIAGVVYGGLSMVKPEYPLVTSGETCGYSEERISRRPHPWKECPNPSKVIGYQYSERVTQGSGWVDGGRDPEWHCTNVKREKERAVGQSIVWSNQETSQASRKDLFGHVEYRYDCTVDAKWGPIYAVERWEGCGEEQAITSLIRKPKTCYDETHRIGWKWSWE
jgi:hypothetical protein